MRAGSDPGWLYATIAQSTAALVAIVGGFLVSRLITVGAERSYLAVLEREALSAENDAKSELDLAQVAVVDNEIDMILEAELPGMISAGGQVSDVAGLVDRWRDKAPNVTQANVEPKYRRRAADIEEALRQMRPRMSAAADPPPPDPDVGLPLMGIDLSSFPADTGAWQGVYRWLWEERRQSQAWSVAPAMPDPFAGYAANFRLFVLSRLEEARSAWARAVEYRHKLLLERERLDSAPGIRYAFSVLVYLTIVGLIGPVVVLATQDDLVTPTWAPYLRWTVSTLFTLGLAALVCLFWRVIASVQETQGPPA